jgi:hypothetical protein
MSRLIAFEFWYDEFVAIDLTDLVDDASPGRLASGINSV